MNRSAAAERRLLGLWTAGCLAVLLSLGVTRLGDWSLQWPLLLVPVLWALVALRPRRSARRRAAVDHDDDAPSYWDAPDHWEAGKNPYRPPRTERTDTVEAPWVRDERRRRPE